MTLAAAEAAGRGAWQVAIGDFGLSQREQTWGPKLLSQSLTVRLIT